MCTCVVYVCGVYVCSVCVCVCSVCVCLCVSVCVVCVCVCVCMIYVNVQNPTMCVYHRCQLLHQLIGKHTEIRCFNCQMDQTLQDLVSK